MSSKIKVLSEETINQIAAGEVIEHPASVVKELVENSLDAGSKHISIEVLGGGFQLIRIVDDGCGMSQDDAILSLERHATSKVRAIEDLLYVSSMGFRGEALASIASISKLTMMTSDSERHQGIKVISEGGKIKSVDVCARTRGTTLEIKALFYTVPARKKFQKSPAQALSDIHKTVAALALSRPDVHFKLISQDEQLIRTEYTTMKERVEEILGRDYVQGIIPVSYKESWIEIEGFMGSPTVTRSNRTGQHIFINQRNISSSAISYAVSDGYGTMLGSKRYPVFVLHFVLDSALLDVNVHPQKKEVRFKDEPMLKEVIKKAMALSLQRGQQAPALVRSVSIPEMPSSMLFSSITTKKLQDSEEFCMQDSKESFATPLIPKTNILPELCSILPQIEDLSIVGIHRQYLLLDGSSAELILKPPYIEPPYQGLLMVDLQAVASRIYFDAVMRHHSKALNMQALLFPVQLSFTKSEALLIGKQIALIEALGIEIRPFGETKFVIEACASGFDEEHMQELLEQLMNELKIEGLSEAERQKKLAIRASKLMRQNKKIYHIEEAKKLVSDVLKTENPYFCPLGKKTLAYLSGDDYKKLFSQ